MPGGLIVISGPSGVGKSTIVRQLVDRLKATVSVSATTRPKSEQEVDKENYYFVSADEFKRMIRDDELLEWAEYLGNHYGTPRKPVMSALGRGEYVVLEIEVEGGKQVARGSPDAIMIYLLPPDDTALRGRLEGRSRDEADQIARRFANAQHEIVQAREAGVYQHWVVNDQVDRAVDEIVTIVTGEEPAA